MMRSEHQDGERTQTRERVITQFLALWAELRCYASPLLLERTGSGTTAYDPATPPQWVIDWVAQLREDLGALLAVHERLEEPGLPSEVELFEALLTARQVHKASSRAKEQWYRFQA